MKLFTPLLVLCSLALSACNQPTSIDWKSILDERLPEYGHRNWIVIADSAYPKQSAPGIETVYTNAGQIEVLEHVLAQIDQAKHIQAITMLDAELSSVIEESSAGVNTYRAQLEELLGDRSAKVMPHEEIIAKLDKGSELFNVLLLKTNLTIPYTSVFIELDCGYWDSEREAKLRSIIEKSDP